MIYIVIKRNTYGEIYGVAEKGFNTKEEAQAFCKAEKRERYNKDSYYEIKEIELN